MTLQENTGFASLLPFLPSYDCLLKMNEISALIC